jgi:hypothetical protein
MEETKILRGDGELEGLDLSLPTLARNPGGPALQVDPVPLQTQHLAHARKRVHGEAHRELQVLRQLNAEGIVLLAGDVAWLIQVGPVHGDLGGMFQISEGIQAGLPDPQLSDSLFLSGSSGTTRSHEKNRRRILLYRVLAVVPDDNAPCWYAPARYNPRFSC